MTVLSGPSPTTSSSSGDREEGEGGDTTTHRRVEEDEEAQAQAAASNARRGAGSQAAAAAEEPPPEPRRPEVYLVTRPTSTNNDEERTGAKQQDDDSPSGDPTPPQGRYPGSPMRSADREYAARMPPRNDITRLDDEIENIGEEEEEEGNPRNVSSPGSSSNRKRRHDGDDDDDNGAAYQEEEESSGTTSGSVNTSKDNIDGGGDKLSEADKNSTAAVASLASGCHHVHVMGGACGDGGDNEVAPDACASSNTLDLTHFYEAMAMINPTERRGWDEAQHRCNWSVLENECCPCYFLRANHQNPWDAAAMACAYWNERITLFQDRAFDALTIGSDEAEPTGLTKQDVELLETGCMQLLPCDREGRSVLFMDRSLLEPHMQRQTVPRLKVLWYLFQKAYSSGEPLAHKVVVIALACRPPNAGFDFSFPARGLRIVTALPLEIETYHLLTLPTVSGTGAVLKTVLAVCAGMLGMYFQSQTKVHHGATMATGGDTSNNNDDSASSGPEAEASDPRLQLLQKLRTHGLGRRGLPECAGGVYTLEAFRNWLTKQRKVEQHMFWTSEQRSKRKREINRIHSRQKRLRRRQEFHELQEQARALERDNELARQANADLEGLLGMVHRAISDSHPVVPAATYSPMTTTNNDTTAIPDAACSHRFAEAVQSMSHHSSQLSANHVDGGRDHEFSNMLAALEPDPISPAYLPKSIELEPDPIAPSCNPKASLQHPHQHSGYASWHLDPQGSAPHSSTEPQSKPGLLSHAAYANPSHVDSYQHMQDSSSLDSLLRHNSGYETSTSTVKLPSPASALQTFFPFFYKSNSAPQSASSSHHESSSSMNPIQSAAAPSSSASGSAASQFWTLYASSAGSDEPPSLSTMVTASAPVPSADTHPSSDPEHHHRHEKWEDGNGGELFSMMKGDDDDVFEPLDHRIAWDQFV